MRLIAILSCGAALTALAGCGERHGDSPETHAAPAAVSAAPPAAPGAPQFTIAGSTKQVMQAITIPNSEIIFGIGDKPPQNDADWLAIENAAVALAESGNLLLLPGRAVDAQEWAGFAQQLSEKSLDALKAAQTRNVEKVFAAGDAVYPICESCHKRYMQHIVGRALARHRYNVSRKNRPTASVYASDCSTLERCPA